MFELSAFVIQKSVIRPAHGVLLRRDVGDLSQRSGFFRMPLAAFKAGIPLGVFLALHECLK